MLQMAKSFQAAIPKVHTEAVSDAHRSNSHKMHLKMACVVKFSEGFGTAVGQTKQQKGFAEGFIPEEKLSMTKTAEMEEPVQVPILDMVGVEFLELYNKLEDEMDGEEDPKWPQGSTGVEVMEELAREFARWGSRCRHQIRLPTRPRSSDVLFLRQFCLGGIEILSTVNTSSVCLSFLVLSILF